MKRERVKGGLDSARKHVRFSGLKLMNRCNFLKPSKTPFDHAVLEDLEKRLSHRFPEGYREFIRATNGGTVSVNHEFKTMIFGETYDLGVVHFFPLNDSGVVDIQKGWRENHVGSDAVLPIADDGGTGFYFLMLDDAHWGQIYFSFKDEFYMTTSDEWAAASNVLPACLGFVANDFEHFRRLIEGDSE